MVPVVQQDSGLVARAYGTACRLDEPAARLGLQQSVVAAAGDLRKAPPLATPRTPTPLAEGDAWGGGDRARRACGPGH